jgi:hypothetical protein
MSDEEKLRRSFFAHIEHKADEVWKSIDDLQRAMEAVPIAERSGPEADTDAELSKHFLELIKRLGDIRHSCEHEALKPCPGRPPPITKGDLNARTETHGRPEHPARITV